MTRGAIQRAAGAGVLLGLLSVAADYLLAYPWSAVGNVAATWVLVAFVVGAARPAAQETPWRRVLAAGALSGLAALLVATLAYYAIMALVWPPASVPKLLPGVVVWGVVAVAAGPLAGAAGAAWRTGRVGRGQHRRLASVAVGGIAALVAGEGVFLASTAPHGEALAVAATVLAVAVVLPLALLQTARDRLTALGTAVLVGAVGVPFLALVIPAVFRLAGSGRL